MCPAMLKQKQRPRRWTTVRQMRMHRTLKAHTGWIGAGAPEGGLHQYLGDVPPSSSLTAKCG